MGWQRASFESDCQSVVQSVKQDVPNITEFGRQVEACKSLLRLQPQAEVVFVRRDGNRAAHVVARRAIDRAESVMGSVAPDWLSHVLSDFCTTLIH
ncbi:hypothetical protein LINPERPRIM_LOCUS17851 [Linum perenne]